MAKNTKPVVLADVDGDPIESPTAAPGSDTGQRGLAVRVLSFLGTLGIKAGIGLEKVSGNVAGNTNNLFDVGGAGIDVSDYRWVAVHMIGYAAGATVNWEGSNDNADWRAVVLLNLSTTSPAQTTVATSVNIFHGPVAYKYFRVRVSGAGAGNTVGVAEFFHSATAMHTYLVSVQGTVASGGTDSGNPVKIGAVNRTTQPTLADGQRGDLQLDTRANLRVNIGSASRGDTYTVVGNGATLTLPQPLRSGSMQVKCTGAAATAWDIRLEGSLDGVNFQQLAAHVTATGDGAIVFVVDQPMLFLRSRCAAITLGPATDIKATILGVG